MLFKGLADNISGQAGRPVSGQRDGGENDTGAVFVDPRLFGAVKEPAARRIYLTEGTQDRPLGAVPLPALDGRFSFAGGVGFERRDTDRATEVRRAKRLLLPSFTKHFRLRKMVSKMILGR